MATELGRLWRGVWRGWGLGPGREVLGVHYDGFVRVRVYVNGRLRFTKELDKDVGETRRPLWVGLDDGLCDVELCARTTRARGGSIDRVDWTGDETLVVMEASRRGD